MVRTAASLSYSSHFILKAALMQEAVPEAGGALLQLFKNEVALKQTATLLDLLDQHRPRLSVMLA
eukprot:CAMPEP_0201281400 /NCGR_PEP_ID=MMETSP1317-20130820/2640_1 /ASSEMBLY_ACC=CAM_ASM_000770 /TAXON_ID=187299 /ORGANISM="Undescribed Undescribed, Strain Undescribed" /LENGTH=64 /DNA_ID=CAMNT_0047591111 /DNA_START=585 /DNA_END=779 /DNA_ORIENTATION=+